MLRDFLVIAALLGAVAGGLAWFMLRKHGPHNDRPLGGENVNVSHAARPQSEVSAAVDPRDPRILLAGSNDAIDQNRIYSSTDGGATWDSRPGPPLPDAHPCGLGDPAVAIGPDGRQYYALLVDATCDREHLHLYVASRSGAHGRWRTRRVEPRPRTRYLLDDKPAIVVDDRSESPHRGRVYVAWSKWYSEADRAIAVSHSDDGGVSWSVPVPVAREGGAPFPAALAVGRVGTVYLSFASDNAIYVTRSTDGGTSFVRPRKAAAFAEDTGRPCEGEDANFDSIPAQWRRCVGPNPQIAVGRTGDVYLTFGTLDLNGTQGVYLVWLTEGLVASPAARVGPPDSMPSDQFWPALTVDRATGDVWACYYDTTADRHRRKAWFTCTVSRDGVHWAAPVRAAEDPSDESVGRADINEYGDYEAVVAAKGVAHPFWTDSSHPLAQDEEIFTAAIPVSALRRRP